MLDVIDKRARLESSLRCLPGPLAGGFTASLSHAERAAAGLWRRDAAGTDLGTRPTNADPTTEDTPRPPR